jgi:maltooligosyltrehalose synthase
MSHHDIEHTPQWQGTILHIPDDLAGRSMHDRLSDAVLPVAPKQEIARVLGRFPVALLAA